MLAGTKDSVDHLVPRSEELLTQTQRQERAISNAHLDLTQKANRIIEELSEVQKSKYRQYSFDFTIKIVTSLGRSLIA